LELFKKTTIIPGSLLRKNKMKRDTFEDLTYPFDYMAELRKAREALDVKVGAYISEHPQMGYREIARMFRVSTAKLWAIAKRHCRKRKPGRRRGTDKLELDVRADMGGKKLLVRVTVRAGLARNLSIVPVRRLIVALYKTDEVSTAGCNLKPDRQADFTLQELEENVKRASVTDEKAKGAVP
jgi:hypothetical protein